jgi:putative membrane protein
MHHTTRRALGALLVVAATFASACSDDDNDVTGSTAQEQQIISGLQSDATIMGTLHQSNVNEITEANIAVSRATDAGVRAFAQQMITDHTTLDQQGSAMAAQLGITPTLPNNVLIDMLNTESVQLNAAAAGTTFDRTYINEQVQDHQMTLDVVDASIQRAQNAALRNMLVNQVRPVIAMHLQMAQQIQARIGQ